MSPERWQQIKALLALALERDPRERAAFLDEACAGDAALRREVETLLDSYAPSEDFIESPAFEVMAESLAESTLVPGTSIGHYQIIKRLVSGGMGDIYLARDRRLERRVVINTLPKHFTRDTDRAH